MNILISALTLFSLYHYWGFARRLPKKAWWLALFGVFLPILDYLYCYFQAAPGLVETPLWFHSPFFVLMGLAVLASWTWIWTRSVRQAVQVFWPLVGLLLYLGLTVLSTDAVPMLRPFSEMSFSLGWVRGGYFFLTLLILLLWLSKRWTRLKTRTLCATSLALTLSFIGFSFAIQALITYNLPAELQSAKHLRMIPTDLFATRWALTTQKKDKYIRKNFSILSGWEQQTYITPVSNDFDLAQALLLDPQIRRLYIYQFKNPVMTTTLLNEQIRIEFNELTPLRELIWTKSIVIIKNASGPIETLDWKRGYLF